MIALPLSVPQTDWFAPWLNSGDHARMASRPVRRAAAKSRCRGMPGSRSSSPSQKPSGTSHMRAQDISRRPARARASSASSALNSATSPSGRDRRRAGRPARRFRSGADRSPPAWCRARSRARSIRCQIDRMAPGGVRADQQDQVRLVEIVIGARARHPRRRRACARRPRWPCTAGNWCRYWPCR